MAAALPGWKPARKTTSKMLVKPRTVLLSDNFARYNILISVGEIGANADNNILKKRQYSVARSGAGAPR